MYHAQPSELFHNVYNNLDNEEIHKKLKDEDVIDYLNSPLFVIKEPNNVMETTSFYFYFPLVVYTLCMFYSLFQNSFIYF